MNREIKFRVWDMVDYMSKPFTLLDFQEQKIQFVEGLKLTYPRNKVIVEFRDGKFNISEYLSYKGRVIGNIYENPELLP